MNLKSVLDLKRTFKLKVKKMAPERLMVWGDSKGNRTYIMAKNNDNTITFTMSEKISGIIFPMYAKCIPPFDKVFEQFAVDLKKKQSLFKTQKNKVYGKRNERKSQEIKAPSWYVRI